MKDLIHRSWTLALVFVLCAKGAFCQNWVYVDDDDYNPANVDWDSPSDDGFIDDNKSDDCKTIQEIICSAFAFETYCDALRETDLDEKLDGDLPNYTVFVPTNSAFKKLFYNLDAVDEVLDFTQAELDELVLVHIHRDSISKANLKNRCQDPLYMENGDNTRTVCENSAEKIYQKGPKNTSDDLPQVISFDIEACNGIIHVVNRVILPSTFVINRPTRSPTRRPTRRPTRHPNRKPTQNPTRRPTRKPTGRRDAACSAHPRCADLGLTGDCCPTNDNERLECCDDHKPTRRPTRRPTRKPTRRPTRNPTRKPTSRTRRPTPRPTSRGGDAACSANPACAALGLTGDCCPTDDGERLECCDDDRRTRRPTPRPTGRSDEGSCSAYPKCRRLGLEGECCPTDDGLKLDCCFDSPRETCSANPQCKELGLKGDCCPTDDNVKLDCCFDKVPGTCSRYSGCKAKGLEGDCCPAKNGSFLDCCYEDKDNFPIIDAGYCKKELDFTCYKNGLPECCLKSSISCPKEEPQCEVGFPIVGYSYCTYAPNYGCYENGWPQCCEDNPRLCPKKQPSCDIEPIAGGYYCSQYPEYQCYELGFPTCCFDRDGCRGYKSNGWPACNVGKRGCDLSDSLPSIYHFACSQNNFDILCELLRDADLDRLLDEEGTYTIFAPSNDAFRKLGNRKLDDLREDPTGELRDILKYHVSDRIYFEKDLYCNRKIDTLRGDTSDDFTTTKCNARGWYQVGQGNDEPYPEVIATDIVTCNGVVHVTDKVILPRS